VETWHAGEHNLLSFPDAYKVLCVTKDTEGKKEKLDLYSVPKTGIFDLRNSDRYALGRNMVEHKPRI
jgi:hypothetical protein